MSNESCLHAQREKEREREREREREWMSEKVGEGKKIEIKSRLYKCMGCKFK